MCFFFYYYHFRLRQSRGPSASGAWQMFRSTATKRAAPVSCRKHTHTHIVLWVRGAHEHHLEHRNFSFFLPTLRPVRSFVYTYAQGNLYTRTYIYTYFFCIRLLLYRPPPPVLAPVPCSSQVRAQRSGAEPPRRGAHLFCTYTRPTRVRSDLSPGLVLHRAYDTIRYAVRDNVKKMRFCERCQR